MGTIAAMRDGRIVSLFSEPATLADLERERPELPVYIRYSADGGRIWTPAKQCFSYPAGMGGAVSGLPLVDHDGNIHLFSMRFYSIGWKTDKPWHSIVLHNLSRDGGETWSDLKQVDFGHNYTGSLNSALQMDNGRILLPLAYLDQDRPNGKFVSTVVYSDDGGATWGKSNDCPVSSGGAYIESGACEPVAVQFRSGSPAVQGLVWMVIRTQTGYFWESFSNDGAIWTPPHETRIVASNAPAGVLRLKDGRIAMFWNNLFGEPFDEGVSYARQYLHGAISQDDGQTWSRPKVVAQRHPDEPFKAQTTYPFLCQAPDGAIVLLYHRVGAQPERNWYHPIREVVRVDPDWLSG